MLQGYELWLTDRQGRRAFRPAAAHAPADVMREARALLEADPTLREIAIEVGGEELMILQNLSATDGE
jgi:hypothetical protein